MDQTGQWEAAEEAARQLPLAASGPEAASWRNEKTARRELRAIRDARRQERINGPVRKESAQLPGGVFRVYFDGGGNKQVTCYGSWDVEYLGFKKQARRVQFERLRTNNTAEWQALICALEWLQSVDDKQDYAVEIYGDSQLVICQLSGKYRCKNQHLELKRDEARELLSGFGSWKAEWRPRANSVRRFGH